MRMAERTVRVVTVQTAEDGTPVHQETVALDFINLFISVVFPDLQLPVRVFGVDLQNVRVPPRPCDYREELGKAEIFIPSLRKIRRNIVAWGERVDAHPPGVGFMEN